MKKLAGIVGTILILLAAISIAVLLVTRQRAQSRDQSDTSFGVMSGDVPPCAWEVSMPERVVAEKHAQAIVVNTTNSMDVACQSAVTLLAPGFDVTPRKDEQVIAAQPNGKGSIAWIATPDDAGEYEIVVTDGINSRVLGVTVTNLLGLTALQLQLLAVVGSVFGPMLSVPWWWERWQQRKRARPQSSAPAQ